MCTLPVTQKVKKKLRRQEIKLISLTNQKAPMEISSVWETWPVRPRNYIAHTFLKWTVRTMTAFLLTSVLYDALKIINGYADYILTTVHKSKRKSGKRANTRRSTDGDDLRRKRWLVRRWGGWNEWEIHWLWWEWPIMTTQWSDN